APVVEVPRHRTLLDKRIVDALVVDGRRCNSPIRPIVAHDEFLSHWPDASRKADLVSADSLKVVAVFHWGNLSRVLFRTAPEDKNRRDVVRIGPERRKPRC